MTFGGGEGGSPHPFRSRSNLHQYDVFTSTSLNTFPTIVSFSAPGISLYLFYSRERKLLLLLEKEKKGEVESGKSHHTVMYTCLSRVKLCAVRMRKAIQRDNLKETCC